MGNYIKPGPSSNRSRAPIVFTPTADAKYFIAGNVVEGRPEWTGDNRSLFDRTESGGRRLVTVVSKPFDAPELAEASAQAALVGVLENAGATRPVRDAVDARIVCEVRRGTGAIIDSQWEVGGWPDNRSARPPADTDRDGMPDDWEKSRGLNPRDPADGAAIRSPSGYTNLEEYLNELAANPLGRPRAMLAP